MRRYILTGTPGSGKTTILRQLEMNGFSVVEEAATDVIALQQAQGIAEPWTRSSFIDAVVDLQRRREVRAASETVEVQIHDRSAVCTAALADYLGFPFSKALTEELEHLRSEEVFQRRVIFVGNLGFVAPSDVRRISYEEALRFEAIHERAYRRCGYELVYIEAGMLADRVAAVTRAIFN